MATHNFSDYKFEQDSNGDYVVTHTPTDTVIERIDSGNTEKILEVTSQISTLTDANTGNTVYDGSSEELTADVNNESVDTDDVNRDGSFREGTTVHYDSRDTGPYVDGQDALADVPPGGAFVLAATEYDVATEGRLLVNDTTPNKRILGEGWVYNDDTDTYSGSVIINTGSDAIDSPPIELIGDGKSNGKWETNNMVADLAVRHEGTGPAINFDHAIHGRVIRCGIDGNDSGETGIQTEGESFFHRSIDTQVQRITNKGWNLVGAGGDHQVIRCQTSAFNGQIGVYVERPGFRIRGGQHDIGGTTGGTAIKAHNPEASSAEGGVIEDVLVESSDIAVEIDGSSPFNSVNVVRPRLLMNQVGTGVRFLNTNNSHLERPTIASSGGTLIEWGANSARCGARLNQIAAQEAYTVDSNAFEPFVTAEGEMNHTNVTNDTNLHVEVEASDQVTNENRVVSPTGGTAFYKYDVTAI